jgi:putative FmdB family regulatory protein
MPIFEFKCNVCNNPRKFSVLVGVVADSAPPVCPKCGSQDVTKTVSRFARIRSEDESIDSLTDRAEGIDENDPRAMRGLIRDMASEMGDDIDADEFEALMEDSANDGSSGEDDF